MFRVGLDIDGCINNFSNLIYEYAVIFNKKHNIDKQPDLSDYSIDRFFGWSKYMTNEFWTVYYKQALASTTPQSGAAQTIGLMKRNGIEIYLITARVEKYREITLEWLKKNNIKFDKLIMSREKAHMCLDNQIDIMVEDEPENTTSIAAHIPVLCMAYKYNECLEGMNNVKRVTNWAEIYNEVTHYIRKKEAV